MKQVQPTPQSGDIVPFQQPRVPARPQAFSFHEIERIAEAIARGGLFGSNNLDAVLTLCMVAHAEGQHPAVVFRDYNIIQGRPAKTAEAMHRDFLLGGGNIQWLENSDTACEAVFSHPKGGSATIRWDMERARLAGLLERRSRNNRSEPTMWEKFPRQMLRSRTVSEGCRTVWPAATGGFYETGEVIDIMDEQKPDARRIPVEEVTTEQRDANARDFANRVLSAVASASCVEELETIKAKARNNMRKLARTHAEIYKAVTESYEAKTHALHGYPAAERSSTGDIAKAFEADLESCDTPAKVWELERHWRELRPSQPEQVREAIDMLFMARYHDLQDEEPR